MQRAQSQPALLLITTSALLFHLIRIHFFVLGHCYSPFCFSMLHDDRQTDADFPSGRVGLSKFKKRLTSAHSITDSQTAGHACQI